MSHWKQLPDIHYSSHSHFAWPNPGGVGEAAAAAGTGPAAAQAATATGAGGIGGGGHPPYGPRGYHPHGYGYGYGRGYWRPRFGFFRRAVWFGLGVGAASWYIHRKQEQREPRSLGGTLNDVVENHPHSHSWSWSKSGSFPPESWTTSHGSSGTHRQMSSNPSEPMPTVDPALAMQQPIEKRCGWASRRENKKREKEQAAALKMEAQEIKAAVEKAWADRKKEAEVTQAKVDSQAKDAAREKLEVLSKAVEKMREALSDASGNKDSKLV